MPKEALVERGEEYLPGVQLSELEETYERPGKSRDRLQGAVLEWRGRALSAGPFRSEPSRQTFPPFQKMRSTPFPMRSNDVERVRSCAAGSSRWNGIPAARLRPERRPGGVIC